LLEKLLVEEARRRAEVFKNLNRYLRIIYQTVKELDENAETYVFGSVVEGKSLISSDIDILVVTSHQPEHVISKLWKKGIKEPFEIHVVDKEKLKFYLKHVKAIKKLEF